MALNPPINQNGQPMRVEGEYFVLHRKDMEIEAKVDGFSKKKGKGTLYVTTARLVFVNKNHAKDSFKSFDMPMLNIYDEKFEQPIFGANYLSIKVKPLHNLLPGDSKVKLWFMSGGCQKFLDVFTQVLPQIRKRKSEGADPAFIKDLTKGNFGTKYAYHDPSDPSVIFIEQPATQQFDGAQDYYGQPPSNPNIEFAPKLDQLNQAGGYETHYSNQNNNYGNQNNYQQQNNQYQQQTNNQNMNSNPYPNLNQNNNNNNNYQQQQPQVNYGQQQNNNQFNNVQVAGYGNQQNQQYQQQNYQQQQQQQQQQQHQQQQPQGPNVGYYYGWWGPNLQNNQY